MFEVFDSSAVDSKDDEDEIDYLTSENSGGETDWQFFGETTNHIKISLDYIMLLNRKPWHMLNLEYFRSFCSLFH